MMIQDLSRAPWHVVAIRRNGVVIGHQLRIAGGGRGHSMYFGCVRFGGPEKSRRAAERMARDMGMPQRRKRGGSTTGRLMCTSHTKVAGIRFEWTMRTCGPVLRVVATWTDKAGRSRHTSFSVQRNGLEGALDRAIAARTSCGAPEPDRPDLLQRLQQEFVTGSLRPPLPEVVAELRAEKPGPVVAAPEPQVAEARTRRSAQRATARRHATRANARREAQPA